MCIHSRLMSVMHKIQYERVDMYMYCLIERKTDRHETQMGKHSPLCTLQTTLVSESLLERELQTHEYWEYVYMYVHVS